jgi:Xaa-Pro aminopeptidase
VRIENVMVVRPAATKHAFGGQYLELEYVTCVPLGPRLLEPSLLTPAEVAWLNTYNGWVRATLAPLLEGDAKEYLLRATGARSSN